MDNLLSLIENGENDLILSDPNYLFKLNELIKYELVMICNESIILTEKGKEAQKIGIEKVLKQEKGKEIKKEYLTQNKPGIFPSAKKKSLIMIVILLPLLVSLLYLLL